MKFSLKLCLAFVALALFGVAIGMFGLSFANYQGVISGKSQVANGFEIAFAQSKVLEEGRGVATLIAFIFVALGAVSALCVLVLAFAGGKKKKSNSNAKLLCACAIFVVCGVVPAVLLFLTLQTTGWGGQAEVAGKVLAQTKLGIGAILAAIFSVLGASALAAAELK